MPKVGFVVNPLGGGGASMRAWDEVAAAFPEAKVFLTTRAGGGTEQALAAVKDGCNRIAAVGGDGTVNEVANALIGTDVAMAVVPAGTGNDYAKTLNLPTDPVLAANLAFEGKESAVDVGIAEGHRHFVNIAGAGFDAEVMTRFNSPGIIATVLPVKARYYMSILRTFAGYKGVKATIEIDGRAVEIEKMLLLAVGCAQYYGAGMHILPSADLRDGMFDVVWGENVRMAELNKLMSLIYKGRHIGHPNVKTARCQEVIVHASPKTRFHLDGDVTGETPVTFRTLPQALKLVVP